MSVEQASEVARFDVTSPDPDVADAWLRDTYVDYRRRLYGDLSTFTFGFTGALAPGFSIATVRHGLGFEAETETLDDALVVTTTLGGRVEVAGQHGSVTPELGTPYLVPPGGSWRVRWEDLTSEALRLERSVVDRVAAGLGWNGGTVRFTGAAPRSTEWAHYVRATIRHVRDDVLADGAPEAHGLVLAEAARSLAVATLLTFPNDAVEALERGTPASAQRTEPAVIRRAVEFVDANAQRDIGVADIAEAARLGVRGLQVAFRRHRDQTPLEYLRQVRMENAHRDLRNAEPAEGATVAEVASRWGFTHPGRFAVEYRRLFGRHPSETLRA